MLPNLNILTRTFRIRTANGTGTAFTIDFVRKRYLVTAQHVVGTGQLKSVAIESNRGWEELQVGVVGHSDPKHDITVLSPITSPHHHSRPIELLPDQSDKVSIGQEVYFSGFALGLSSPSKTMDFPYPLPLVRRGILSSYGEDYSFLDGFVNPGMSGGPVFRMDSGTPDVIGVVTHRFDERTTESTGGQMIELHIDSSRNYTEGRGTTASTRDELQIGINAGMVRATPIEWVLGLISQNPVGFRL